EANANHRTKNIPRRLRCKSEHQKLPKYGCRGRSCANLPRNGQPIPALLRFFWIEAESESKQFCRNVWVIRPGTFWKFDFFKDNSSVLNHSFRTELNLE